MNRRGFLALLSGLLTGAASDRIISRQATPVVPAEPPTRWDAWVSLKELRQAENQGRIFRVLARDDVRLWYVVEETTE